MRLLLFQFPIMSRSRCSGQLCCAASKAQTVLVEGCCTSKGQSFLYGFGYLVHMTIPCSMRGQYESSNIYRIYPLTLLRFGSQQCASLLTGLSRDSHVICSGDPKIAKPELNRGLKPRPYLQAHTLPLLQAIYFPDLSITFGIPTKGQGVSLQVTLNPRTVTGHCSHSKDPYHTQ